MWYLFSQTVLISSSVPVGFEFREVWSPLSTAAEWLALAVINAAGVLLCYQASRQGDNREFVNRFACPSWPVTIRLMTLFVLPIFAAFFGAAWWASWRGWVGDDDLDTGLVPLGFGFALPSLYYWRLRSHLRSIAAVPSL